MSFEIEGLMHKIFDTEAKTESFQAREFVISIEGNYPQFVKFQLTQDRCGLVDSFNEGEKVKVYFDLRGREWQGRYFTNLNAWKIEKGAVAPPSDFPEMDQAPPSGFDEFDSPSGGGNSSPEPDLDDLPF